MVEVKGPKGTLQTPMSSLLNYELTEGLLTITRKDDTRESNAQHGLRRTLVANCVEGVSKGFSKTLEVIGVGFKVAVKGNIVDLSVGFSHPVLIELPKGLEAKVEGNKLTISGIDKELVGEYAARIRRVRKPEPYKGKGIKYDNEIIRRKAGKSGGKGK
jgi:large subunit ribosomal protein L6